MRPARRPRYCRTTPPRTCARPRSGSPSGSSCGRSCWHSAAHLLMSAPPLTRFPRGALHLLRSALQVALVDDLLRSSTAAHALRSLKTNTVPAFGTTVLVPRVLSMAKGRISAVLSPGPPLAYRAPRLAERGGSRLNSAAQGTRRRVDDTRGTDRLAGPRGPGARPLLRAATLPARTQPLQVCGTSRRVSCACASEPWSASWPPAAATQPAQ